MPHVIGSRGHTFALLAMVGWAVAGCVGVMSPAVAPGTRACVGLPQATCEQIFRDADAEARARGKVVVGIAIRCTSVCTDASGEAERSVTYSDGTSEQGGFGWQAAEPVPVGGPIAPEPSLSVAPTCVGLDVVTCESRALESVSDPAPGDGEIVSIVVRCTPGPCTSANGEGETTITFADGTVRTTHWGYAGSP
ncbi:MAG: hypothetical protein ABWY52_04240 [Candidatus Limnocylindrales bacterium]